MEFSIDLPCRLGTRRKSWVLVVKGVWLVILGVSSELEIDRMSYQLMIKLSDDVPADKRRYLRL